RIEKTERIVKEITEGIKAELPENGLNITSAFVGMHPAGSPINPIFLFSNSSHEAVLQVSVNQEIYQGSIEYFKEVIRKKIQGNNPEGASNFEPLKLPEKIMGQGPWN